MNGGPMYTWSDQQVGIDMLFTPGGAFVIGCIFLWLAALVITKRMLADKIQRIHEKWVEE